MLPPVRSEAERADPHPVYREFMSLRVSSTFARDEVRDEVVPVYMGLIKQIDDQLGLLFRFLQERGLFDNTMIVFTSDHGDYLGDHWLGEKDLFHEPSVKVPLIIYDPSPEADKARGSVCDALVEAIDLAPTFLDAVGGDPAAQSHRLEGRSLLPFLHGETPAQWRRFAISEYDYAMLPVAAKLGVEPRDARLFMVADQRWKYVHAIGFRPMLYDLEADPQRIPRPRRRPGLCRRARPPRRRPQPMGPAPLAAHHAVRRPDQSQGRQVPAPGHPDRRLGRERPPRRALEQVPGRAMSVEVQWR